jgi:hypothetical protein
MPLNLPPSPVRRVYREIVRTLQADATLDRAVRTWRVWDGRDKVLEVSRAQCPALMLTPTGGAERGRGATGYQGALLIDVRLAVPGTNWDDLADLWYAVQKALYPTDDTTSTAIRVALDALGVFGEIEFDAPLRWQGPDSDLTFLAGLGRMTVPLKTLIY